MARKFELTIDCLDPVAAAAFWSEALGYALEDPPEGFASWEQWLAHVGVPEDEWNDGASIVDPDGAGCRIFFQKVPEAKVVKNRLHLDLDVSEGSAAPVEVRKQQVEAEVARLEGIGAIGLAAHELVDHYHVVMQDPQGNEFCLR